MENIETSSRQISAYEHHRFGGDLCWYCGVSLTNENRSSDHFWPKHLKGRIKVWACKGCNHLKRGLTPIEFIKLLKATKNVPEKMFLWQHPDYEKKPSIDRMINATQTLWDRIKWSLHWREKM